MFPGPSALAPRRPHPRQQVDDNCRHRVHTAGMRRKPLSPRPAYWAAMSGLISLSLSAHAQVATAKTTRGDEAMTACERTVRQTLAARPAEVTFNTAPTVQPSLSGDGQIVLRGEGRWSGTTGVRRFNYSCNVDLRTSEVIGVVMRDSIPVPARATLGRGPAEPDLSHLSLAACESSAVQALKERWPRISQISFDSATRSFRQETSDRAELHGRGRALPAQGLPSTLFGFDCEIDPQDGQVLSIRLSG